MSAELVRCCWLSESLHVFEQYACDARVALPQLYPFTLQLNNLAVRNVRGGQMKE